MTYKTLLVYSRADETGNRALGVAKTVGRMFNAAIFGVAAESFDLPVFGDTAAELIALERNQVDADLALAQKTFDAMTDDCLCGSRCISTEDLPLDAMARHARAADLIVACRPPDHASASSACDPTHLLMQTGLPMLLAPDGTTELRAEHIVVAWKDRREAIRAVSDALPFLMKAKSVHVVSVCGPGEQEDVQDGLDEVRQRLARHGVAVDTEIVRHTMSVTAELDAAATRHGADLIVTGAYSHTRLREWVLGGVTQDLMAASSKFLLLSR